MPFLMAETPIIKEGMNGFYPWANIHKKNPRVNDIGRRCPIIFESVTIQKLFI